MVTTKFGHGSRHIPNFCGATNKPHPRDVFSRVVVVQTPKTRTVSPFLCPPLHIAYLGIGQRCGGQCPCYVTCRSCEQYRRNCFWGWNWMEHKFTTKVEAWVVAGDMVPLTREGDNTSEAPESGFESITRNVAGLSHGCRCGGGKRIYLEVAIVQLHVLSVICRWTGMLNVHKGTTDHELNMTQADGFPRGLGGSSWSGDRSDLCWAFHAQFVEAVVCQVQRWKPTIHKSK